MMRGFSLFEKRRQVGLAPTGDLNTKKNPFSRYTVDKNAVTFIRTSRLVQYKRNGIFCLASKAKVFFRYSF